MVFFISNLNFDRTFILHTDSENTDRKPHIVASYLGLHCLYISYKNNAGLTPALRLSASLRLMVEGFMEETEYAQVKEMYHT